jgi:hypothetical protein
MGRHVRKRSPISPLDKNSRREPLDEPRLCRAVAGMIRYTMGYRKEEETMHLK